VDEKIMLLLMISRRKNKAIIDDKEVDEKMNAIIDDKEVDEKINATIDD
jgi:hypothetical protein